MDALIWIAVTEGHTNMDSSDKGGTNRNSTDQGPAQEFNYKMSVK